MTDRQKRKEKKSAERREQILKAALEVFSRKGYEAATVPEIAGAAGVAAGTIYLYFPSKRELFVAVVKNTIFTVPLLDLIGKIPTGNFEEVFKNILKERFSLIKKAELSRMPGLIAEVARDPELKDVWLDDFLHPFTKKMEMAYRMLCLTGKARRIEPALAVRMIGGMIFGFLMLKMIEGETSPLNKLTEDEIAESIVGFVLHGLIKNPDKPAKKKDGKK